MLELPQKFENDIQGNTTNLIPLVVIDNRLFLSTNECSLDNHYLPLLSSLGSIRESIDISDKNFQTSNVNLEFYNYKYLDMTLSHKLFSPSVMNKPLTIYLKSQSAETLDDCLMIYTGFIRDIQENNKIVSIDVEDKTQDILDIDLPQEFVRDDIGLPEKYNNKRVPLVYGYVDKAPCVFYNIITSDQSGGYKFSITPDNSFLNQVIKPYVFVDDVYMEIKQNANLFSDFSIGTLYSNVDTEQYIILDNKILIDKTTTSDEYSNSPSSTIPSMQSSPIGHNFVEVIHNAEVIFAGGTHNLYHQKDGEEFVKNSIPIKMFSDIESQIPTNLLNSPAYLDVKDFSDIPDDFSLSEFWFWGVGTSRNNFPDYFNIYGENIINFEANEFCSESNILKELAITDTTNREIRGQVNLEWNMESKITDFDLPYNNLPYLMFQWKDVSATLWDIDADDKENDIYVNNGTTQNRISSNISNNIFSIGQRQLISGDWTLIAQNGAMEYLKVNNLNLVRQAILNNFTSYSVFAELKGRVDRLQNSVGFYTGEQQQATVSTGNVVGFSATSSGSSGGGGY